MTPPALYPGQNRFAWHARTWTGFSNKSAAAPLAILPVCGLTDWGLGRPLDAEEMLACAVLDRALDAIDGAFTPLVLPPCRHLPSQHPNMMATVDIETAHRSLFDIARSVMASGVSRLVLLNANPFCEEWIDVAARDLRIDLGLQTFCVNLSGLGLDFHNGRSPDTSVIQAALGELLGAPPDPLSLFPLDDPLADLLLPVAAPPADADLTTISLHLAGLLREIHHHPPLSHPS